jgi:Flp pilus assembly protein TadG
MRARLMNERGAALLETAITVPIILLIAVGIFEFGRAYQTWQVLTNAAREGARIAILAETTDEQIETTVERYMRDGGLPCVSGSDPLPPACDGKKAAVHLNRNAPLGSNSASRITVSYPFRFMVLNPIVQLVTPGSSTGQPITMQSVALMRNEG